ncbi:MAG: hypothetical protein ACFB03_10910 [Paracoccaceae bacterium]
MKWLVSLLLLSLIGCSAERENLRLSDSTPIFENSTMGVRTYGSDSLILIFNKGGFGRQAFLQIIDANDDGFDFGPIRPGFWVVKSTEIDATAYSFYYFFEEVLNDGLRIQFQDGFSERDLFRHREGSFRFVQLNTREEFILQTGDIARLEERVGQADRVELDREQLLLALRGKK